MKKVIIGAVLSAAVASSSFAADAARQLGANSMFQKDYKTFEMETTFSKNNDGKDFIVEINGTFSFDAATLVEDKDYKMLEKFKPPFKVIARGVAGKAEIVSFTDADGKDLIAEMKKTEQKTPQAPCAVVFQHGNNEPARLAEQINNFRKADELRQRIGR